MSPPVVGKLSAGILPLHLIGQLVDLPGYPPHVRFRFFLGLRVLFPGRFPQALCRLFEVLFHAAFFFAIGLYLLRRKYCFLRPVFLFGFIAHGFLNRWRPFRLPFVLDGFIMNDTSL